MLACNLPCPLHHRLYSATVGCPQSSQGSPVLPRSLHSFPHLYKGLRCLFSLALGTISALDDSITLMPVCVWPTVVLTSAFISFEWGYPFFTNRTKCPSSQDPLLVFSPAIIFCSKELQMFIVSQLHLCPKSAESGQFCGVVQVNSIRFNTHTHKLINSKCLSFRAAVGIYKKIHA